MPPSRRQLRLGLLHAAARALGPSAQAQNGTVRILVIRPDHIGDVLLSADAIALLRASLPEAHLTYLVGPWSAAAARRGPPVDAIREIQFPGFTRRRKRNVVAPYAQLAQIAIQLRKAQYRAAVVLRPDHWWGALLALAAGIPTRIGVRTLETEPLLTHIYVAPAGQHAAETALGVARLAAEALGKAPVDVGHVAQFTISPEVDARAQTLLPQRRVVALHPSAGAPLKSWPLDRWAQLADALCANGLSVVLTGAPADRELLESIQAQMHACAAVLCGQSLEVSAATYARCGVVVTVDSGAGHLAAAVGTPTVRLYGPAPPTAFGPWPGGQDQHVLITRALGCAPCGHLEAPPCGASATPACMLAVGVDDVLKAVRAQLGRG